MSFINIIITWLNQVNPAFWLATGEGSLLGITCVGPTRKVLFFCLIINPLLTFEPS